VHSNSDPIESYANIRRFINVDNPGASKLARYGGNGHCQDVYGDGRECGATTEAIRDKILAWYNEGEKDCRTERKFVTEEQLIPTDLPGRNKGFKKMRWSLDSVSPALTGAKLETKGHSRLLSNSLTQDRVDQNFGADQGDQNPYQRKI
jgi:hypothetical protein